MANKMGTLVEDMVAPNLPTIARELFGCDGPESFAVRIKRNLGSKTMELDALLVCKGVALINETKSNLNNRDVDGLAGKLETFSELFPEYAGNRCVGVIASLYVDESVVRYATSQKILCMGMKEDTMSVLNPEAVQH